jgi:hypothetical protein
VAGAFDSQLGRALGAHLPIGDLGGGSQRDLVVRDDEVDMDAVAMLPPHWVRCVHRLEEQDRIEPTRIVDVVTNARGSCWYPSTDAQKARTAGTSTTSMPS